MSNIDPDKTRANPKNQKEDQMNEEIKQQTDGIQPMPINASMVASMLDITQQTVDEQAEQPKLSLFQSMPSEPDVGREQEQVLLNFKGKQMNM